MLQITPLMAYLLPEAKGMTIGGNILLLPLLKPVHVAEEAATIDVLSEGNFGGPPVWVAGLVEAAVRRAARIGDAWLISNATTLGGATEPLMRTYRDTLATPNKTVAEFPIARECYVGTNHATAMEECRGALEYKYSSYAAWGMESPTANMTFADMARDRFIIGDKVSVKEEIARWQETLGVNHFVMRVQWPGLDQDRVLGSIRRLAEIFA
jgi:alkanesulfonate monooxygenase SsuD/methylene tetrahydromethanopterin reductase-like flavin-dependent oxidoreductase (luciferase family)